MNPNIDKAIEKIINLLNSFPELDRTIILQRLEAYICHCCGQEVPPDVREQLLAALETGQSPDDDDDVDRPDWLPPDINGG